MSVDRQAALTLRQWEKRAMTDLVGEEGESAVSRDTAIDPALYPLLARLPMQYVLRKKDLERITFSEGLAMVMVADLVLPVIGFKNDERAEGPRLRRLMRLIRARGYLPTDPIICRIGQKGKWVVVDGGHRLTALRRLREARLSERLVSVLAWFGVSELVLQGLRRWFAGSSEPLVYFVLFTGPRSLSRNTEAAGERARVH